MLDADARLLLSPFLARYRTISRELDASRHRLRKASELAAPGRAQLRRRRELRQLQEKVEAEEAAVTALARQIDDIIDPILRRHDPAYLRLVATVRRCRQAVDRCEAARGHFAMAAESAGDVRRAVLARREEIDDRAFRLAWSAARYSDGIRDGRTALRELSTVVTTAAAAVVQLLGPVPPAPMPDLRLLKDVPTTVPTTAARLGPQTDFTALATLTAQLDALVTVVKGWHRLATETRKEFVRAIYIQP
jgi:hypothetical protein